jgi:hypothetical protein
MVVKADFVTNAAEPAKIESDAQVNALAGQEVPSLVFAIPPHRSPA